MEASSLPMLSKQEFDKHFDQYWLEVKDHVRAGTFERFLPPTPGSGEREVTHPVTDLEITIRTYYKKKVTSDKDEVRFERTYERGLLQTEFYRIYTHPLAAGGPLHEVEAFRQTLKVNGKQGPLWIKQLAEFKREFYNRFVTYLQGKHLSS